MIPHPLARLAVLAASRTLSLALALAALATGCRYDPVPAQIIADLGPETGTPGPLHRPGQPCLACHDAYGGATPALAVAGTVFMLDASMTKLVPAKNVRVNIVDSAMGGSKHPCTNAAGNFMINTVDWADIVYPLSPVAGSHPMTSLIGRDGSCASCHKLPDPKAMDPSMDKITGAGRDSAGVVLVGAADVDPACNGGGP